MEINDLYHKLTIEAKRLEHHYNTKKGGGSNTDTLAQNIIDLAFEFSKNIAGLQINECSNVAKKAPIRLITYKDKVLMSAAINQSKNVTDELYYKVKTDSNIIKDIIPDERKINP